MKKLFCLFSLMVLFSQANSNAMHRKSMKKIYNRKAHQKRYKGAKNLHSIKFDRVARHKKVSRKKKINSVDAQSVDKQCSVGGFIKALVPRLRIGKNPLLAAILFPVVLSSIVNNAKVATATCKPGECYHGHEHECKPGDVYYQMVGKDCALKCTCKKFGEYWQYSCSGTC